MPTQSCLPRRRRELCALPRHSYCLPTHKKMIDSLWAMSAAGRSPGKEGRRCRFRRGQNRPGQHEEEQCDDCGDEYYTLEFSAHRAVEGGRRLVEIHDLDNPQVIKRRDDAGHDADYGEPGQFCVDRREEYVELGKEAGGWRNPA